MPRRDCSARSWNTLTASADLMPKIEPMRPALILAATSVLTDEPVAVSPPGVTRLSWPIFSGIVIRARSSSMRLVVTGMLVTLLAAAR